MSETQPCQHEPLLQLHGRTIVGTKRCKHCGLNQAYWDRATAAAPDPRIAAADEMAKALKTLIADLAQYDAWNRPCFAYDDARDALAAYNALR